MSFDLDVYGRVALTPGELAGVVSSVEGLTAVCDPVSGSVDSVVHHASGAAFTLEGPFEIEPEDIPDGWIDVAGSTVLYNLHVPYDVDATDGGFEATADGGTVTLAMALAERLAEKVQGKAIDLQSYEPPAPVEPEPVVAPKPQERELQLHLEWYRLRDGSKDLAADYLRAARAFFPLAVPTRFGPYEPFQGKFPRDADDVFDRMYREECRRGSLDFTSGRSVLGHIDDWSLDTRMRFQSISVVFSMKAVDRKRATGAVEEFLVAVARATGSFFAFAEVNDTPYLTAAVAPLQGGWGGLPEDPQWMTWYLPEYVQMVRPYLTAGAVREFPEGVLHRWTEQPAVSAELRELAGRDPWVGSELLAVPDPEQWRKTLESAKVMPESLRPHAPGSPEALRLDAHFAEIRAREKRS